MSRFYAEIKGNRGIASRTGFKDSGMWSHTRGWHTGAEVQCSVDTDDKDVIKIYATSGSGCSSDKKLIATIHENGIIASNLSNDISFVPGSRHHEGTKKRDRSKDK